MVTSIDGGNESESVIEDLTPVDTQLDTDVVNTDPVVTDTTNDVVDTALDTPAEPILESAPEPTQTEAPVIPAPPIDQRQVEELRELRAAKAEKEWRDKTGRQARAYESQLQQQGYLPEQARDQARRFVMAQQQQRQQEEKASEMIGFVEGRQQAAIHFMKENGLASQQMLDDLASLQRANTPDDMKREAERMKRERALIAENARLKQGLVQPQSFDNSQGAAEAQPNDTRLLDAYNNGDRSEAAIRAARRFAFGS